MFTKLIISIRYPYKRVLLYSFVVLTICIALRIVLDIIESKFNNYSFYFSESLLFASVLLLFLPLLYGQFYFAMDRVTKGSFILFVLAPITIHLFAYPALVWLISKLFYYHTFSYWQTFTYGLTQYLFILMLAYTVPFSFYHYFKTKAVSTKSNGRSEEQAMQGHVVRNLIVMDGNKRSTIDTTDILFISANPPYINIHHSTKQYLHSDSLKSILTKLDHRFFIRIHKSTIVNLNMVQSYKSRLNGDYDLLLKDGTEVRLSRNFATNFKSKFENTPQVTI